MANVQVNLPGLSKLCKEIDEQRNAIIKSNDVGMAAAEEKFWVLVSQLDIELRKPDEVLDQLGLKNGAEEIRKLILNVVELRKQKKDFELLNATEKAMICSRTINGNIWEIATQAVKLQSTIEGLHDVKMPGMETGWGFRMLERYYQIIATAGGLDDLVKLMDSILGTNPEEKLIKISLFRQKNKLSEMSQGLPAIKDLCNIVPDFPQELRSDIDKVELHIKDIIGMINAQDVDLADKAPKVWQLQTELKKELQCLYMETVKRSVQS